MINYIFFGSPRFAEIVLQKLLYLGFPPKAVVCNPDKPFGRNKILTPPPTKLIAEQNGIKVFQPIKIDEDFMREVKELNPEIFLIAAYSKILPESLLSIPKFGSVGVHPSLLPLHRGSSPIQNTILSGDNVGGVTLYLLDKEVDHGSVLGMSELKISGNENYLELEKKLAELGGDMTPKILEKYIEGDVRPVEQRHENATFTKKFITEDGLVDIDDLRAALGGDLNLQISVDRKIRALNPDPGVYTVKDGKRIKLLESEVVDGVFTVKKIQLEGKTPTSVLNLIKEVLLG